MEVFAWTAGSDFARLGQHPDKMAQNHADIETTNSGIFDPTFTDAFGGPDRPRAMCILNHRRGGRQMLNIKCSQR